MMSINMNLQENIKRILREDRKLSNFLKRRFDMLNYEVESRLNNTFGGGNICIFFKSEEDFFETIMEESIDFMYYNYFSNIDDNSGEWAHIYLDMVNYIRKNYQYKIMKHYDDNCGSGLIPLKESIRKVLREESEDKKLKLVKSIIYNMFDNIINLEYNTERNEITVYYDKQEELDGSEICDTINNFTGLNVVLWYDYKKRMELKKKPDFYLDTERYEEELNESTYLRRRADMSTIDKKFFTNLNIVTDKYLRKHNNGQYCSFNVFRTTVISYLIDDYRDNLSDEDYDNFPGEEVYNFLLNHFYDKIKDRYDTFFGNNINESVDKSEDKKLKLVKSIIYNMFDNVSLEYDSKANEILIYHDKEEKLEISEICDTINDFTGLNVVPWFEYDKNRIGKEPDFYLDIEEYGE
jgi:hypothetical protein